MSNWTEDPYTVSGYIPFAVAVADPLTTSLAASLAERLLLLLLLLLLPLLQPSARVAWAHDEPQRESRRAI